MKTPQDIANEIRERIEDGESKGRARADRLAADVTKLRDAQDQMLKDIAYLQVGSGQEDGRGPRADRLKLFNAMQRARKGPDAPQHTAQELAEYDAALASYLRLGQGALDRTDIRAALSIGSDPSGGYTILPEIDPQPREKLFRTSPMRAIADVLTITQGDSFVGLHDDGEFLSGWTGELGARDETDAGTLAQFQIFLRELYALVPLTQRLIDLSSIDIVGYVENKLGSRFRREQNAAFVTGNGILKPRGFLDYAAAAVTTPDATREHGILQYLATGAAGNFPTLSGGADDPGCLFDVKAALHSDLRAEGTWVMNSTTEARIGKLRDAEGRWLFTQSLVPNTPNMLLGSPISIMEDMPDIASGSFAIAFGNFRAAYLIVDRPGVRILRDPYTTKGQTKVYAYQYVGGDVVTHAAIKLLKFSVN